MGSYTQQFGQGGVPINEFMASGDVYFVRPSTGSNSNSGKTPSRAFKTLAQAVAKATHFGDTVYLIPESNTAASTTDYQSSVLTWSTDGVHLIGLGSKPMIGQRARISNLSTATTFTNLFTLSADNCYVRGLEFFQGAMATNAAASHYAVTVSGQRNRLENCQISGIGHADLDDSGSRSLLVTGSENYFKDNYIGLDTVIRATATAEIAVTDAARTVFEGCIVNSYTSNTSFKALNATSIDRFVILKDCMLSTVQGITSAVAPTGAIATTTLNGQIWVMGGGVFGYDDVTTADNSAVLVLTHGATAANIIDMGVAKGTDIAA